MFSFKKYILTYVFLIFCPLCNGFPQEVFVSSSIGSDDNTGSTKSDPLKTIGMAKKKGGTIYLKAGDVFYEYTNLYKQKMQRYGEGENPELRGMRYIVKGQWKNVNENIWKLDLTRLGASGYPLMGTSELNNVGCFYEYEKDVIHGHRKYSLESLNVDWDFFQCTAEDYNKKGSKCFDFVYLFLQGNPNALELAITVGSHYGLTLNDSDVEGVNISGFGTGGINLIGTSSVKGCRIDIVGGSMMLNSEENVCLGNGIDFWLYRTSADCIIEGNYISRCYDCGCSIQGARAGMATPRNIVFRDNLIAWCCQGWEDFLRNDSTVKFENCRFEKNIVVFAGNSGFGYPESRQKKCNVLGNNIDGDRGMIIRKNIFVGGNYYCSGAYNGKYMSNIWDNNTHYIHRGAYLLSNYIGTEDVIVVPDKGSVKRAITQYRVLTGDWTTRFKVRNKGKIDFLSKRFVKKYMKYHSY